jgi:membrane-associated phospholipid phosphatase
LPNEFRGDDPSVERKIVARAGTIRRGGLLSGLVWHSRGPARWERPVIWALQHVQLPMTRSIVLLCDPLPFAVATLALAWMVLRSQRVLLAFSGTVGCVAAILVTETVLKPLVDRHHPYAGSAVFPSAHVTAAAAWAMFAWLVIDPRVRVRGALVVVPIAMAWAVVSSGAHYPADAVAGLFLGGLVVYGIVNGADQLATTIASRRRHAPAGEGVHIDRPIERDRTAIAA